MNTVFSHSNEAQNKPNNCIATIDFSSDKLLCLSKNKKSQWMWMPSPQMGWAGLN